MGFKTVQSAGSIGVVKDSNSLATVYGAAVQPATSGTVTVEHVAFGPFVQTTIRLDNVAQAVVNGTEHQGTKIFSFPQSRMYVVGATATLQQKTTSAILTTLNQATGAIGVGTATSSATTLSGTMQDIIPTTAFTSSATINVAGTAVNAVLASPAVFDGTGTAKDLYLNTAYATTTDVDADATQTISGVIRVTWFDLGDLPAV